MNTNPKFQFKIWVITVQTDMSLNSIHVTQNHQAGHCSVNDLDGVNEKELIGKEITKGMTKLKTFSKIGSK